MKKLKELWAETKERLYWFWREWGGLIIILSICAAIIFGMASAINAFSRYQCSNYERITGKETTYAEWDSCYVGSMRWDEYLKAQTAANFGIHPVQIMED